MDIRIAALRWKDISDDESKPCSRLLGELRFDGVSHHLEAIEVEDRDGTQCAVDSAWDDMLTEYVTATGADGPFSTVEIRGRAYVLLMTPYCQ